MLDILNKKSRVDRDFFIYLNQAADNFVYYVCLKQSSFYQFIACRVHAVKLQIIQVCRLSPILQRQMNIAFWH